MMNRLQSAIRRQVRDRGLHDLELSGVQRDLIKEYCGEDNVTDRKQSKRRSVNKGSQRQRNRHARRRGSRRAEPLSRLPRPRAARRRLLHSEHIKKNDDR